MKNFIQTGDCVDVTATSDVSSGDGVLIDSLFVVAATDAATGETFTGHRVGVFDLPKTSAQAWTAGVKIYWDNNNSRCTTGATSNKLIGVAALAAANPSDTGRVILDGAAR